MFLFIYFCCKRFDGSFCYSDVFSLFVLILISFILVPLLPLGSLCFFTWQVYHIPFCPIFHLPYLVPLTSSSSLASLHVAPITQTDIIFRLYYFSIRVRYDAPLCSLFVLVIYFILLGSRIGQQFIIFQHHFSLFNLPFYSLHVSYTLYCLLFFYHFVS